MSEIPDFYQYQIDSLPHSQNNKEKYQELSPDIQTLQVKYQKEVFRLLEEEEESELSNKFIQILYNNYKDDPDFLRYLDLQKRKINLRTQEGIDDYFQITELSRIIREHQKKEQWKYKRYNSRHRIDHYQGIEELPYTIDLEPVKWEYYYNWDLTSDFRYKLKSYKNPTQFIDGIQQWETWTLELSYKRRIKKIDIEYRWEYLYFYLSWYPIEKIFLSPENRGKIHRINFWSNIPHSLRGKKKWSFVELFIKLNWR